MCARDYWRWRRENVPGITEQRNAYEKSYHQEHKGERALKSRNWRVVNPKMNRRSKLWREFGVTLEDYDRMLVAQGNGCAICGTKTPGGRFKNFCVDHEHVPGYEAMPPEQKRKYVRGLLCNIHNKGLGIFGDSTELLHKAIRYLEAPPGLTV